MAATSTAVAAGKKNAGKSFMIPAVTDDLSVVRALTDFAADLPDLVPTPVMATDKNRVLKVNAAGTAFGWEAESKELPAPTAGTVDANKVLALGTDGQTAEWKAITDITELKPAVANAAALPATSNNYGDIRVTLDSGRMHIWVKGVPDSWDDIGPAAAGGATVATTEVPLAPAAVAKVGSASGVAARADHVHPAELPAHAVGQSGQVLTVDATGTGVEWAAVDALPSGVEGNILVHNGTGWVVMAPPSVTGNPKVVLSFVGTQPVWMKMTQAGITTL
jgi:hypothetical protein